MKHDQNSQSFVSMAVKHMFHIWIFHFIQLSSRFVSTTLIFCWCYLLYSFSFSSEDSWFAYDYTSLACSDSTLSILLYWTAFIGNLVADQVTVMNMSPHLVTYSDWSCTHVISHYSYIVHVPLSTNHVMFSHDDFTPYEMSLLPLFHGLTHHIEYF